MSAVQHLIHMITQRNKTGQDLIQSYLGKIIQTTPGGGTDREEKTNR